MTRFLLLPVALLLLITGCTTINQSSRGAATLDSSWGVVPFINNTETPYAGDRAEAIAVSLLYGRGVRHLESYRSKPQEDGQLLPDRGVRQQEQGVAWAKEKGVRYVLLGTVTEWRYKVGLDGEPVVGMTLQLVDLKDDRVLWSGSAGKSGWSRDAVSAVAQQVLAALINSIDLAGR